MTPKIRRTIVRIAAAFALFIAALLLAHFNPGGVFGRNIQTFLMYLIPYIIVGYDVLKKAATGVINRQMFDECFLMTLATFGAFAVGEFSEAVGVMLFYQVGEVFQDLAVNRSRTSITELMDIVPESANLERDGQMTEVDPDDVEVGDIIVIRPGEKVPLDGVILSGDSFLDTSALTGESVPQKVLPGDEIFSGCINGSGILRVRVTKEFDDSTVAQILELVENASVRKAKIENFITRYAGSRSCSRCYRCISAAGAVRGVDGMADSRLHLPGHFLPVCSGDFRASQFLRGNRGSFPQGSARQRRQLCGSAGPDGHRGI